MAISKRKIITSCKLLFTDDGQQFVEVAWAKQVLEDGVVISSDPHCGAYPVDPVTGNPDQSVQTVMGIKLSKLLSNAGDNAQAQLLVANNSLVALQAAKIAEKELSDQAILDAKQERDVAKQELDAAKQNVISLKQSLNDAKNKLSDTKQERRDLRKRLKDNDIDDSDIPDVEVGDLTPVSIESVKVDSFKV